MLCVRQGHGERRVELSLQQRLKAGAIPLPGSPHEFGIG
jgi:hypothetical protein